MSFVKKGLSLILAIFVILFAIYFIVTGFYVNILHYGDLNYNLYMHIFLLIIGGIVFWNWRVPITQAWADSLNKKN